MPAQRPYRQPLALVALAVLTAVMTVACSNVGSGGTLTPRSPDTGTIAPLSPEPSNEPSSEPSPEQPTPGPSESEPRRATVWVREGEFLRPVPVLAGITDGIVTEVSGEGLSEGMEIVAGEVGPEGSGASANTNPFGPPQWGRGGWRAGSAGSPTECKTAQMP